MAVLSNQQALGLLARSILRCRFCRSPSGLPMSPVAERPFIRRSAPAESDVFPFRSVVDVAFVVSQRDIASDHQGTIFSAANGDVRHVRSFQAECHLHDYVEDVTCQSQGSPRSDAPMVVFVALAEP